MEHDEMNSYLIRYLIFTAIRQWRGSAASRLWLWAGNPLKLMEPCAERESPHSRESESWRCWTSITFGVVEEHQVMLAYEYIKEMFQTTSRLIHKSWTKGFRSPLIVCLDKTYDFHATRSESGGTDHSVDVIQMAWPSHFLDTTFSRPDQLVPTVAHIII
jgi:hypothetical protein